CDPHRENGFSVRTLCDSFAVTQGLLHATDRFLTLRRGPLGQRPNTERCRTKTPHRGDTSLRRTVRNGGYQSHWRLAQATESLPSMVQRPCRSLNAARQIASGG